MRRARRRSSPAAPRESNPECSQVEVVAQRRALEELEDDVGPALVLPRLEHGEQVGMVEGARCPASYSKRRSRWRSPDHSGARTFTATSRRSRSSRALYTLRPSHRRPEAEGSGRGPTDPLPPEGL